MPEQQSMLITGYCEDCGRRYGSGYGFPEVVIDDVLWASIAPLADGGGMLCPDCLCRRLHRCGITAVVEFKAAPTATAGEQDGRITP